ncbi:conserved domain protein (plasmid) [Bacillus cereus AH1134]|nr:conserved domain protein [Bacillus cereus AH1134]
MSSFTCTLGVKKVLYCLKTIKKYNNHRVSLLQHQLIEFLYVILHIYRFIYILSI